MNYVPKDSLRLKPIVEAVLYAIAEQRFGPGVRLHPLAFTPKRGAFVDGLPP